MQRHDPDEQLPFLRRPPLRAADAPPGPEGVLEGPVAIDAADEDAHLEGGYGPVHESAAPRLAPEAPVRDHAA